MLEEQGKNVLTGFIKNVFKFWGRHFLNLGKEAEQRLIRNTAETGKKSVKSLVKSGCDLELSETIKSKEHLKAICYRCKQQGLAFALKKTDEGYRILYDKRKSVVFSETVGDVLKKELKPNRSIKDILATMKKVKEQQAEVIRKAPLKHREVNVR